LQDYPVEFEELMGFLSAEKINGLFLTEIVIIVK
jgi:hypothetical protein